MIFLLYVYSEIALSLSILIVVMGRLECTFRPLK